MKMSVRPTEMLKFFRSPESLAWMNSSTSGWSQRSTPICAPRREPADSTVSQERSNTRMYDTGPEALDWVLPTQAPRGRMREKS